LKYAIERFYNVLERLNEDNIDRAISITKILENINKKWI